jgi:flagellin
MPLSIATNLASMTAQRSFLNSNADLETAFERLSTGKRVNSSVRRCSGSCHWQRVLNLVYVV